VAVVVGVSVGVAVDVWVGVVVGVSVGVVVGVSAAVGGAVDISVAVLVGKGVAGTPVAICVAVAVTIGTFVAILGIPPFDTRGKKRLFSLDCPKATITKNRRVVKTVRTVAENCLADFRYHCMRLLIKLLN
jgi:hypothetical protein